MKDLPRHFEALPNVKAALTQGKAVVALESTILTHGMPYPRNVEMAIKVDDVIRQAGAVPALIAVIDGKIHVGVSDAARDALAQRQHLRKLSRADLGFAVSEGLSGGTTVAATTIAAAAAGISVFATGGIGGVHRGAETSFDVSADLIELGRSNVIVVAAGAKAILDLPKTFEYLETQGVPVVAYGADELPAFWSRQSGLEAPLRLDTPEAIARFYKTRAAIGTPGGMLVANPIPLNDEIAAAVMSTHIEKALTAAGAAGVTGKGVTPFLLQNILEQTGGKSLESNIALVCNNARLAAEIALALTKLQP